MLDALRLWSLFAGRFGAQDYAAKVELVQNCENRPEIAFFVNFARAFGHFLPPSAHPFLMLSVLRLKSDPLRSAAREIEAFAIFDLGEGPKSAQAFELAPFAASDRWPPLPAGAGEVLPETRKFESPFSTPDPRER